MPRILQTPDQENARLAGAWVPQLLCKVAWGGTVGDLYYTEANIAFDPGVTTEATIIEFPQFVRQLPSGIDANILTGSAQFSLFVDPDAAFPINDIVDFLVLPNNARVDFYYVFVPEDGTPITQAMWETIGIYRIDQYKTNLEKVTLSLIDFPQTGAQVEVLRRITATDWPKAPESSYGLAMPWAFGSLLDYPLIPLSTGATVSLDGDITPTQQTIPITGGSSLPASGVMRAGSEKIGYTAKTSTALGSALSPCERGADNTVAVGHIDGAVLRELLATYDYGVADHECNNLADTASVSLTAAKKTIAGTVNVVDHRGHNITLIQVGSGAFPTITSTSPVSEVARLDGEFGGWVDLGSTTKSYVKDEGAYIKKDDSAEGAIDGTEFQHVTFLIADPKAGETSVSVQFDNDLSDRSSLPVNVHLVVDYKIVLGESLDEGATDYDLDDWVVGLVRDGVQIIQRDIAKPGFDEIKGILNKQGGPWFRFGDTTGFFGDPSRDGPFEKARIFYSTGARGFEKTEAGGLNRGGGAEIWRLMARNGMNQISPAVESYDIEGKTPDAGFKAIAFGDVYLTEVEISVAIPAGKASGHPISRFVTVEFVAATQTLFDRGSTFTGGGAEDVPLEVSVDFDDEKDTESVLIGPAPKAFQIRFRLDSSFNKVKDLNDVTLFFKMAGNGALSTNMRIGEINFLYEPEYVLSGENESIVGDNEALVNALLGSASDTYSQRMDITDYVINTFENRWEFTAKPLVVNISASSPTAATLLMIPDIRIEVKEKAITERQATDEELVVTLDVDGFDDSALLEDPGAIIEELFTNARWWNLDPGFVDTTSLNASLAETGADGWKFGRRIDKQTTPEKAVMSALADAGVRTVWDAGKWLFAPVGSLGRISPTRTLSVDEMPAEAPGMLRAPLKPTLFGNSIDYAYHRSFVGQQSPTRNLPILVNQESIDFLQATYTRRWISDWHRQDDAQAQAHALLLLSESAWPKRPVTITGTPEWFDVLTGDAVTIDDPQAGSNNEPARVIKSSIPQQGFMQFTCETLAFKTRFWEAPGDSTTYIDAFHGSQLVFVIEGVTAAYLTQDGVWHLREGLDTLALAALTQTEVIEKTGSGGSASITFAADKGNPSRNVVLILTKVGFLQVDKFDTNPDYPSARVFADYIEESGAPDLGTVLAGVWFSANKASTLSNAALAQCVARQFVTDNSL